MTGLDREDWESPASFEEPTWAEIRVACLASLALVLAMAAASAGLAALAGGGGPP